MLGIICSFVSGLLCAFSGASEKTAFLAFLSPSLFFFILKKTPEKSAKHSFFYGLALWGGSCLFLFELFKNGYIPSLVLTFLAFLLLSCLGGIIFFICFLVFRFVYRSGFPFVFSVLCSYLLAENIPMLLGQFSFPWTSLSSFVACYPPFLQIASLGGPASCTSLVVIINAFISLALSCWQNKKRVLWFLTFAVFVFTANISFGVCKMSIRKEYEKITVAVVQGNLSDNDKWYTSKKDTLFLYSELIRLISQKAAPSLIVLPETAYPWADMTVFTDIAKESDSFIIFGAFELFDDKIYNSAYVSFPNGNVSPSYRKRRLVPFGEYDPFGVFNLDFMGNICLGDRGGGIETPIGKVGFLLCFESLFSYLNRQNTADGAELTVVLSNDSWFGDSSALYRHLCHSVLRAVESGRSVVCAANTGISCIISKYGVITASAPKNTTAVFSAQTEKIPDETLNSSVGDIVIFVILLILLKIEFFLESVYTSASID